MIQDRVLRGAAIGIAADLVKLLFNYIGFALGFSKVVFWQMVASRFLSGADLFHPVAYLIGGVADLTMAAILGVVFVYLLPYIRPELLWIKGAGFGLGVWVVLLGTLLSQSAESKLPVSAAAMVITLIAHLLFGLALAYFYPILNPEPASDQPD
jgi:hypothetical protein